MNVPGRDGCEKLNRVNRVGVTQRNKRVRKASFSGARSASVAIERHDSKWSSIPIIRRIPLAHAEMIKLLPVLMLHSGDDSECLSLPVCSDDAIPAGECCHILVSLPCSVLRPNAHLIYHPPLPIALYRWQNLGDNLYILTLLHDFPIAILSVTLGPSPWKHREIQHNTIPVRVRF